MNWSMIHSSMNSGRTLAVLKRGVVSPIGPGEGGNARADPQKALSTTHLRPEPGRAGPGSPASGLPCWSAALVGLDEEIIVG